ncbi:MAG: hypothetical protein KGJ42_03450, partial [Acidobacteriota bacterium]|nr:hypothetical protein [Acidobacteriota bacterium]
MVVLSALLGLVVGLVVGGVVVHTRGRSVHDDAARVAAQLLVRDRELAFAHETIARLRDEHASALAQME